MQRVRSDALPATCTAAAVRQHSMGAKHTSAPAWKEAAETGPSGRERAGEQERKCCWVTSRAYYEVTDAQQTVPAPASCSAAQPAAWPTGVAASELSSSPFGVLEPDSGAVDAQHWKILGTCWRNHLQACSRASPPLSTPAPRAT